MGWMITDFEHWGNRISDQAQKGAKMVDCGKMCGDCAFKVQPNINNYEEAVEGAVWALMTEGSFNCHTSEYGDAGVVCKGFLYAKAYLDSIK